MKLRTSLIIASSLLALGVLPAGAATIAAFTFPATSSLAPTTQALNTTTSNVTLSPTATIEINQTTGSAFPNEPFIEETGGWTATSQATAKYFVFTITAAAGYTIDISNVSFNALSTSAGPSAISMTVGSTSFAANNAASGALLNVSQAVTGNTGLSSVQIRIEGWLNGSRITAGTGAFRLDDILVEGTVNAVPEPTSAVLGALGMIALLRRRR